MGATSYIAQCGDRISSLSASRRDATLRKIGKKQSYFILDRWFFLWLWAIIVSKRRYLTDAVNVMRTVSHIMITLSTLMMLLFGSGIGWQRCTCTGKVSLVLPAQHDCCKRGSSCMTVTITQLSTADLQHEKTSAPLTPMFDLGGNHLVIFNTLYSIPTTQFIILPSAYTYWYPPGWTDSRNMVMRVWHNSANALIR